MSLDSKKQNKQRLTMRERREIVFILLFQMMLSKGTVEEVLETAVEEFEMKHDNYTLNRARNIDEKAEMLDEKIASFSPKRSISRIARTNIIILRIAFYEILFDEKIPYKVSINEAVELAKKYADNADKAFINGVLDRFVKSLDMANTNSEISTTDEVTEENLDLQANSPENSEMNSNENADLAENITITSQENSDE